MKKNISRISWLFVFLAIVLAAASTQLQLTFQSLTSSAAGHAFLATGILESVLQIGSAVLFILGLKDFKTELRHAYILIVSGIVLMGLSRLQVPIFQILNLWESVWVDYGFIESISGLAHLLLLAGLISFATLLHIKTKLCSWRLILSVLLLAALIIWFLPHSPSVVRGDTELSFNLFALFGIIETVFGLFSVLLVIKIKQNTSPAYANALAWLFFAILFSTISAVQVIVFHFIGFTSLYVLSGMILLPGLISSVLFLKAGKAFNFISSY